MATWSRPKIRVASKTFKLVWVAIDSHVERETSEAVLFIVSGRRVWVPKSRIYLYEYKGGFDSIELNAEDHVTAIQTTERMAKKKELSIIRV